MVRGINLSINSCSISFSIIHISSICFLFAICTISGLSAGLPLAKYIFFTASLLKAFAAIPYTVSVGNTIIPLLLMISAHCLNSSLLILFFQLKYFVAVIIIPFFTSYLFFAMLILYRQIQILSIGYIASNTAFKEAKKKDFAMGRTFPTTFAINLYINIWVGKNYQPIYYVLYQFIDN